MSDLYHTIQAECHCTYTQMRSKFIAYALPVTTRDEAMEVVERVRKEYFDARHVCWAYRLGADGADYRINDDGEPSGTAGKPIHGQMVSAGLTDLIVLVVRYFGGVKLGTSGLIEAYRESARLVLESAERKACILTSRLCVHFGYDLMGEVMRAVKDSGAEVLGQDFQESCILHLSLRQSEAPALYARLESLYTVQVSYAEQDKHTD